VPFITVSAHVGVWHVLVVVPEQTPLVQSPGPMHTLPFTHLGQLEPQSLSVSVPFLTLSVQVGIWQMPDVHTPLVQSPGIEHLSPGLHLVVQEPPQSTSVSLPF
jgi:hypothetical protein